MFDNGIEIFDGANSTELYERGFYINRPFEELNQSAPRDVVAVHRSFVDAGVTVISTNTFAATKPQLRIFDIEHKQAELLKDALRLANEAITGTAVKIVLALGPMGELVEPLGPTSTQEVFEEYAFLARTAIDSGLHFDGFYLESFSNLNELASAVAGIRSQDQKRTLIASALVEVGQKSKIEKFAQLFGNRDDVQILGLDGAEGPSEILNQLKVLRPLVSKPILVKPTAGIPRQINTRYFYMTSPDYLAKYAKRYVEAGANGIGGSAGIGPKHIAAVRGSVRMMNSKRIESTERIRVQESSLSAKPRRELCDRSSSQVAKALASNKPFISIELTSPRGTDLKDFFAKLAAVRKKGVDFVNVPDGARASTRISSLHLASVVAHKPELGITVLPHFTTRDRNLIALQADLLGAYVNGVSDVLIVTGDPPKIGNNKDATGVYDIDSIGLTHLADCLNRGTSPTGDDLKSCTSFGIGVASNPTAINIELEIQRWKYKVEMGADFAVTQPIYDADSYFRWLDSIKGSERPHFIGIWPFVSLRNAEFMANEVPGVHVPTWALEEMAKSSDPADAIKRGIEIARRTMQKIGSSAQGFCISAPLGKVDVALELVENGRVAI